ncbi:phosphotransferase family protein [Aeromicrobium halocynthiae]|uniref:Phosphotransferase family protein n=1 Tax=Aeromicrobium halocynthiae TaxID=560557 RepID=A0ABN2VVN1_9ACTN
MPESAVDLDALRRWLDEHAAGGVAGPLSASLVAGGRSNPTFALDDGTHRWILRRPPFGRVLPTAHDMHREHRVLSALADAAGVAVPRVVGPVGAEDVIGAPFYVMERLEGRTLRSAADTADLTRGQRARLSDALVDLLVALHAVRPADVGLEDFGRPDGYLDRQLSRWRRQWEASATEDRPVVDEVLRHLGETVPTGSRPGIVHGDFKLDNVMVALDDPTRIVGLLDWEMSTLGDTRTDVGILCSFWEGPGQPEHPITAGSTTHDGFPERTHLAERYAAAVGVDDLDIGWFTAFADLKIAVILEGIHARHLDGHTVGEGFDDVGAMIAPLLDRARRTVTTASAASRR